LADRNQRCTVLQQWNGVYQKVLHFSHCSNNDVKDW